MPNGQVSASVRNDAPRLEPLNRVSSGRDVAHFVFRHVRLLVGLVVAVTLLATVLLYFMPQLYKATALILVERGKSPTLRSDVLTYQLDPDEVINSEAEIILSRAVAEGVVDRLGLDKRPRPDTWVVRTYERIENLLDAYGLVVKLPRREKLIRGIPNMMKVKPTAKSNIVSISYYGDSPNYTAEVTRGITDVYIDLHRQVYTNNSSAFFGRRVTEVDRELTAVREAIKREADKPRQDALHLKEKALESSYLFYRDKLDKALADEAADSSLVNVRVIDYPAVPLRPWISRLLIILIAFAASMALAVSIALLRDYYDHGVYAPEDVAAHLDVPVLGTVRRVRGGTLRRLTGPPA